MVVPNGSTQRASMLRSKREYVPPLMLSKGRGKGLAGLYPNKSNANANVDGIGYDSLCVNKGPLLSNKLPFSHVRAPTTSPNVDRNVRASFNPLVTPRASNGNDSLCVNKGPLSSNKRPFTHDRPPTTSPNADRNVRASFNPLVTPCAQFNGNTNIDDHDSFSESCNENINDDVDADGEIQYTSHEDQDMLYQEGYETLDGLDNELNFQVDGNDNGTEEPTTFQGDARGGDQSTTKKQAANAKKRGRNKCKEIARLKPNKKLQIQLSCTCKKQRRLDQLSYITKIGPVELYLQKQRRLRVVGAPPPKIKLVT
ncbi:circumsporozoite protein-like [Chenopodium quinoa]|uniref:circumsporozoite protein-like n=1 Tax=Chenopodium quinoa TaxID=63459 RepID=UPI000B78D677|nr:circumsporozoite protein-like [Chenopodium quinoa]